MNRLEFLKECAILISVAQSKSKAPKGESAWSIFDPDFTSVLDFANDIFAESRSVLNKDFKVPPVDYTWSDNKKLGNVLSNWLVSKCNTQGFDWQIVNHTQKTMIECVARNYDKTVWIPAESYWQQDYLSSYHKDVRVYERYDQITKDSVLIIDLPTRGSLQIAQDIDELFDLCDKKNVQVTLDLTFLLLSKSYSINVDRECIKCINISFSKLWPLVAHGYSIAGYKQGFGPHRDHYNLQKGVCNQLMQLMNTYPLQSYVEDLENKQTKWCNFLDLEPSDCVLHAVAPEELRLYWTHKYWNANPQLEEKQICLSTLFENEDMIKRYFNIDLSGRFYDI